MNACDGPVGSEPASRESKEQHDPRANHAALTCPRRRGAPDRRRPRGLEKWLRDQLKDHGVDGLFSVKDRAAGLDEPAAMSPEDVPHKIATMHAERRAKNAS